MEIITTIPEKHREAIRTLRLIDDVFMTIVFDNDCEATAHILNIFLDREDIVVQSVTAQREYKNPNGRSVRFDIHAVDSTGRHYDVEIQRSDEGADVKRARFNSSLLDSSMLEPGQDTSELCDSYVIFITENDVRGQGRAMYQYIRTDSVTGEMLHDGSHIIYVNGAYRDESSRVGRLMHDFMCADADDMHAGVLADRVRGLKETEGGNRFMNRAIEDIRQDGILEGRKEGKVEGKQETLLSQIAKKIQKGLSFDAIADMLEITVDEVRLLSKKLEQ